MAKTLIFATGNKDKMVEIREIMADTDYEIFSMKEIGLNPDIVEDGTTYEENALIKAGTIAEIIKTDPAYAKYAVDECVVLADDSGIEIEALNNEPGIYSARYLGEDTPYSVKNANFIERLTGVPDEKRTARFVCAIAAVFTDGRRLTTRGIIEGRIGYEEKGSNGFGYDPIFYVPEFGCTTAELSPEEKNKVSHRGLALKKMREELAKASR